MRPFVAISLLLSVCLSAAAQRHSGEVFHSEVKGSRTAITFRIQRQERYTSSCAVVYPTNKVHFEIRSMNGIVTYEGALPEESAAQLRAFVPAIQQIDASSIQRKTRLDDIDIVLINVPVGDAMHNLHFADSSTRKPFKAAIDPALKWLGSLSHAHLQQIANAKPTGCLPEDSFDPGSATAPAAITAAVAQRASEHMLLRARTFDTDEGVTHDRCLLVLPEGQYRYEDHTVGSDDRETTKVYAGALNDDELAELKQILDEPGIRDAQHTALPPNGIPASDIESTELTIPRSDHVQRLDYYSVTGRRAAYANVNVTSDLDDRTLHPLSSFLRNSIEKRKGVSPVPGAAPNRCASY